MKLSMKTALVVVAASIAVPLVATAQDKPPHDPADTAKLSILEVLNVGAALRQFGTYYELSGERVAVPFKFDGVTLLAFAVNIRAAEEVQKAYKDAYAKLEAQQIGDDSKLSPIELQRKKAEIASSDAAKRMIAQPAGALLSRIKESSLCLKSPPVAPCQGTNNIPPALLAAVLPIVEVGK